MLPTPEVVKALEALHVQYPALAERARKSRTPGPHGFQFAGSGQAGSARASCAPMLGVGATGEVGATGAPPPAAGVQLSASPPLDEGAAQDTCTAPLGGHGDDAGDGRESKDLTMAASALERLTDWASIEALQSRGSATVVGRYALSWIAEEAPCALGTGT